MIPFINRLLLWCKSKYVFIPLDDTLDVVFRAEAYAKYITDNLEPGQVVFYNSLTHQVEVGMKH